MELSALTAYARRVYGIEEQHKWSAFPGFSVLVHPRTGQWAALLIRRWDTAWDEMTELCDLKCGARRPEEEGLPFLSAPFRMKGRQWTGVSFTLDTDEETVFRLFDRAMVHAGGQGFTLVLDTPGNGNSSLYRDTPLPAAPSRPARAEVPPRLREMMHLYDFTLRAKDADAVNFCRQGMYMADYEDDAPWTGEFNAPLPTYHDMTTAQLRGYFSWRTRVRRGIFDQVTPSAAYVYLYELINLIGAASPEEALQAMQAFQAGYLSLYPDPVMSARVRGWLHDLCVVHAVPPGTAKTFVDPVLIAADPHLDVLRDASAHSDEEVFAALCYFSRHRLARSPILRHASGKGRRLLCEVWRAAGTFFQKKGEDLFTLCFGEKQAYSWQPFPSAIYLPGDHAEGETYDLTASRSFVFRGGGWQMHARLGIVQWDAFHSLLRHADMRFRRYLKTGQYLEEKPADAWMDEVVRLAVDSVEREAVLARKEAVVIDLSGLERIRSDALATQQSLLTEEERQAEAAEAPPPAPVENPSAAAPVPGLSPDSLYRRILERLLAGGQPDDLLRAGRLLPDMAADAINEALMDEIGDIVLTCDSGRLALVEDYREDIARLLGGN